MVVLPASKIYYVVHFWFIKEIVYISIEWICCVLHLSDVHSLILLNWVLLPLSLGHCLGPGPSFGSPCHNHIQLTGSFSGATGILPGMELTSPAAHKESAIPLKSNFPLGPHYSCPLVCSLFPRQLSSWAPPVSAGSIKSALEPQSLTLSELRILVIIRYVLTLKTYVSNFSCLSLLNC